METNAARPLASRERVDYSPIVARPPIRWPNGAKIALYVAPNVELYEYMPRPGQARGPWPYRVPSPDIANYSVRDYGNRVGFWRMTDILDELRVRCTIVLNMSILEHYPHIAAAIKEREHTWSVMSHGLNNTEYLYGYTVEQERAYYRETHEISRYYLGRELRGVWGPAGSNTENTPDLMAEAGFTYTVGWNHDDQPVPIRVRTGSLVSLPYSFDSNDALLDGLRAPSDDQLFSDICRAQFDRLYAEGEVSGRVMCIALHPYRIGQPHFAKYLREALEYVLSHEHVWLATADDIAKYYMDNYYPAAIGSPAAHPRQVGR